MGISGDRKEIPLEELSLIYAHGGIYEFSEPQPVITLWDHIDMTHALQALAKQYGKKRVKDVADKIFYGDMAL